MAALSRSQLTFERDHPAVGKELRERRVQQVVGLLAGVVPHEVHGHVVGGSERRGELVRARRGERGHTLERDLALEHDDRVAELVDPPPAGAPGELRVLARGEQLVPFALELPQVLDHDRPGRHVDPERQRLGREHHPDESGLEQLLDRFLEHGQHAGVMRGDPRGEGVLERRVAERLQVDVVHPRDAHVGEASDLGGLLARGQPDPGVHQPSDAPLAPRAAEHEVDRGKQPLVVQDLDDLFATRHVDAAMTLAGARDAMVLRGAANPVGSTSCSGPPRGRGRRCRGSARGIRPGRRASDGGHGRRGSGARAGSDAAPRSRRGSARGASRSTRRTPPRSRSWPTGTRPRPTGAGGSGPPPRRPRGTGPGGSGPRP